MAAVVPSDPTSQGIRVRPALLTDLERIVEFNLRLAQETEGKTLDREVLTRGVKNGLRDPERLRYWVAELVENQAGSGASEPIVGQAAITREWSDWRNGWLWWFQSVFVDASARGRGVFRALYQEIRAEAHAQADVIGLRLYVEQENKRAQRTYQALGMRPGGYQVFEELWTDRFASPLPPPG